MGPRRRTRANGVVVAGAVALVAGCGAAGAADDDDDGDIIVVCRVSPPWGDCTPEPDASPPPMACNPVTNEGCKPAAKCSARAVEDGYALGCLPDGDRRIGEACRFDAYGVDDCAGGGACIAGTCRRICDPAATDCAAGDACTLDQDRFGDAGAGVCRPLCDVLAQDCRDGDACYLQLSSGATTCAPPLPETKGGEPGVQGDACMYLNTCASGYGCILVNDATPPTGDVCARFCDPTSSGGPTCADAGPDLSCVQINRFYGDAEDVDDAIGMCIDCCAFAQLDVCQGVCP